ncbi:MAG: HD domain-containing protein, partial [Verrucomicrobiota bacterium]|nr:HD domain-containing protein [Verrucomicrobiota bacterium]
MIDTVKTAPHERARLADGGEAWDGATEGVGDPLAPLLVHLPDDDAAMVRHAWAYAHSLYGSLRLSTGEAIAEHALGIARILDAARADAPARASGLLFSAGALLAKPEEQLAEEFGNDIADIVMGVRKLARLGEQMRDRAPRHSSDPKEVSQQVETLRKMLLAFATDIRVVLVRLASRLQTLRFYASSKLPVPEALARESLDLYAPLANRLGVWQIKWELEDLSF